MRQIKAPTVRIDTEKRTTFQGHCNFFVYLYGYISFIVLSEWILFRLQSFFLCTSVVLFFKLIFSIFLCCLVSVELTENKGKELELVLNV